MWGCRLSQCVFVEMNTFVLKDAPVHALKAAFVLSGLHFFMVFFTGLTVLSFCL